MGKTKHQKAHRVTSGDFGGTIANPALAQGMREIARSNKAGSHDSRPRRQRTRKAAREAALRGW